MPGPEPARFLDGVPCNLPAAALDALEWLRAFRNWQAIRSSRRAEHHALLCSKLDAAIATLETQLAPHLPEVMLIDLGGTDDLESMDETSSDA